MDTKIYTDLLKIRLNGALKETEKAKKEIAEAMQRLGEYTDQTGDDELEEKVILAATAVTEAANKVREASEEVWKR